MSENSGNIGKSDINRIIPVDIESEMMKQFL